MDDRNPIADLYATRDVLTWMSAIERNGASASDDDGKPLDPHDERASCFCLLGAMARATGFDTDDNFDFVSEIGRARNCVPYLIKAYDSDEFWLDMEEKRPPNLHPFMKTNVHDLSDYSDYTADEPAELVALVDFAIAIAATEHPIAA